MSKLNKVFKIEDFDDPEYKSFIVEMFGKQPEPVRKYFEYYQLMAGCKQFNLLNRDCRALSIASGAEQITYYLTNFMNQVFMTDLYGDDAHASERNLHVMLTDPLSKCKVPCNERRLVTQYMNALNLKYPDEFFDLTYSICAIEHFGGSEGFIKSMYEMARVTKPGGYVYITTECIVNDAPDVHEIGISMFSPSTIYGMITEVPILQRVEPIDYSSSQKTINCAVPMINPDGTYRDFSLPFHDIAISLRGCIFTSITMWFRKL